MVTDDNCKMEKKSKKRKAEAEEDAEDETNSKKAKLFSADAFRKELNRENLITSLKTFLNLAEQQKDGQIALDYLEAGGSVQEMLLLLDKTAKTDLTSALPVFRVLHFIFLSIKGNDSEYYAQAEEGAKFMLDSFIPTIQAMININSNKHRRTVLKVLTSIVTLFPSFARDIMNLIPTTPSVISQFLRPQSGTDSVRKWFIFFILSFIVGGDYSLIRTLMTMKGLLGDIMNDLKFDESHTVNVFLSVVREKILENVKVTKTLKLKVFNTQVVTALFELYNWKGPKNVNVGSVTSKKGGKEREVNPEDKELVTESVHAFLLILCTSKKFGIVFADNTFGGSGDSKNNLLLTVIQSLSEPWENKKMSELIVATVVACPDLLKATLSKMESALQPRESKKWNLLLQFVENLMESLTPRDILKMALEGSEIDPVQLAKQFCTPGVLIRNMSAGIRNKTSFPVVYYSMRVLTVMWRKTMEVITSFANQEKLAKALTSSFSNCLLEVDEVLTIWKNVCTSLTTFDSVDKAKFLFVLLDFLEMNSRCGTDITDSLSLITSKMLEILQGVQGDLGDVDYVNIQSRVFYLVTSVDPMSITPDSHLFRKAVTLLLANRSKPTVESLTKIILSTGVFENNESEIDVWLGCYFERFNEYHKLIPDFFADCVCRLYLKEVNFSQALVKTSSKKKSVFTELMEIDTSVLMKTKWVCNLTESPTPMLIQSLELLKSLGTSGGNKKLVKEARHYVSHVAIRLFHYYNNRALLKSCQDYRSELSDSVLSFMERRDWAEFYGDDSPYLTHAESQIMAWFLGRNKRVDITQVVDVRGASNLGLFLTFNTVTSYLVSLVEGDRLSEEDAMKFIECLRLFFRLGSEENGTRETVLSREVDSLPILRAKCLKCLFSVPLVNKFDVYEIGNGSVVNFTKVIIAAVTELRTVDVVNLEAFRPWKKRLLDRVRSNLRESDETLEMFGSVEPVLDRFHYAPGEISDVLNEYCGVTDMKIFVTKGRMTMSTMIFTKFAKLRCEYSDPDRKLVKQLWGIMQHAMREEATDFAALDNCFLHILRCRPKSLSLFDDDFLEGYLARGDFSEDALSVVRILLSDPVKVDHFVKYAGENFKDLKNRMLVVSTASALVRTGDEFSELLLSRGLCRYWRKNHVLVESSETLSLNLLVRMIYKKYKSHFFTDDSKHLEFLLQQSEFFSVLARRFIGKEMLTDMLGTIREGSFVPEVLHDTVLQHREMEGLIESYATGLLTICSKKLKEVESGKCEDAAWSKYGSYVSDLIALEGNFQWEEVTARAVWKDFARLSLRECFNFPTRPSFLRTVRCFVELFYRPGENSRHAANLFGMLISHSQFLSGMLQHTPLKGELVKLYYSLIKRCDNVLSVKHIPVILASYTGSLSENDVILLDILRFYEGQNVSMSEYEPLVWGEPAVSHYSVKTNVGVSLWRRINMLNVLEMLDARRMEVSLKEFPVGRTGKVDEVIAHNDKVYDPAFLLPIFTNLLSPGAVTYCLPFVQKGCFAYTICSLSSVSKEIRITGCVVLARLYNHLELVQNMKLKSVWLHFINCLRYAIDDIGARPLPSVVTYFLAKASLELSGEPGEMFMSLQKFILAKPIFNFEYIPEFLPLFHSSDIHYMKHRRWILEILRDGFKQSIDLNLLFQTMAVKIILSYFRSQFCSRELKCLVLEVLTNILKTGKSKLLISEYGLLTWLNAVSSSCDKELFGPFVKLVRSVTVVVTTKLTARAPGMRNLFYPIQILNILMKVLPNLSECRSSEAVETHLTAVLDCLTIMLKFKHRNWCKLNRAKLEELTRIAVRVTGDERLGEKYSKSKYFFALGDGPSRLESLYQKISFAWDILLDFK